MELNWLESLLYAFVSGLAEFLPVSSRAHQALLLQLFGKGPKAAVLDFFVHIAMLVAVVGCCRNYFSALKRCRRILAIPPRRRKRNPDSRLAADVGLLKTAVIPVLLLFCLYPLVDPLSSKLQLVSVFLLITGVILYISGHVPIGSKHAGYMSRLDGILLGAVYGIGVIPGISAIGMLVGVSTVRGASPRNAVNWALCLSVPALAARCIGDIITMFTAGVGDLSFLLVLQYLVCSAAAYAGVSAGISATRFLAEKLGISLFSFYCWGLSLFSFVLFMI